VSLYWAIKKGQTNRGLALLSKGTIKFVR